MQNEIVVHIGEVKIARNGEVVKVILGSCVGIAMIWRKRGICGVAHCLLSKSAETRFSIGAKYVDQAFRSLMVLMKVKAEDISQIELIIVGGGNMSSSSHCDHRPSIGSINFAFAMSEAKNIGMKIIHADGEGNLGRKLTLDGHDFSYNVELIPRLSTIEKEIL